MESQIPQEAQEDEMDIDGRIEIGTPRGSLLDALGELQIAMADAPDEHATDGRWSTDGTTAAPPTVVIPEAASDRRPAPATRPRGGMTWAAQRPAEVRPEPAPVPSVVDRIATMPRYRTEVAINHPTGEAWLSPKQRQFCERPPV